MIAQHAEDHRLTGGAQAHEGEVASRLGLAGWPAHVTQPADGISPVISPLGTDGQVTLCTLQNPQWVTESDDLERLQVFRQMLAGGTLQNGAYVIDTGWNENLIDVSTSAKRNAVGVTLFTTMLVSADVVSIPSLTLIEIGHAGIGSPFGPSSS